MVTGVADNIRWTMFFEKTQKARFDVIKAGFTHDGNSRNTEHFGNDYRQCAGNDRFPAGRQALSCYQGNKQLARKPDD